MAREMKDSGIEWIGEIPRHWDVRPIKNSFSIVSGSTPDSDKAEYWEGDIPWITPADFKTIDKYTSGGSRFITEKGYDSCSTNMIPKGSIIFSKRAPIGSVVINKIDLCTNQGCLSCIKNDKTDSAYFYYLMSIYDDVFNLFGSGTTFKEISATTFGDFILPLPPLVEQQLVSSFLDSKCAEIDKAIDATKASIEEYRKLRQAIITETVTKGLDPDVEMKDSGIEWIGEIPATWTSMPTKNMFLIGKGLSITKDNLEETGVPTISYRQIHAKYNTGTHLDDRMFRYVNESYLQSNKQSLVHKGCFVFADTSEDLEGCGNCVYADREGEFFAGYHTVTLFPKECEDNKYFAYLFRTNEWRRQIRSVLTEVKVYSVSQKIIRRTSMIIPPASEQKEICSYLDSKCSEIDSLIKSKEKLIEELTAYRKSLIYEYVTGKKEVPAV